MGVNAPSWTCGSVLIPVILLLTDEMYLQVNVHLPKDRISMSHQGYGFCEFLTEEDAEYACKIMNQIKLWGKPIRVNKVSIPGPIPLRATGISDTMSRHHLIKSSWTLAQIFSSETWILQSTSEYCTTRLPFLVPSRNRQRYRISSLARFKTTR